MALKWIEGFEGFAATGAGMASGALIRKYPGSMQETYIQAVAGRLGGQAVKFTNASNTIRSPVMTTNPTMILGFAFRLDAGVGYDNEIVTFYADGTRGMNLRRTSAGAVQVYNANTLLGETTGIYIANSVWYYFEFKVVAGASGSYEVRLNGATILQDSGVDTRAGGLDYYDVWQFNDRIGVNNVFDDLYCVDGDATGGGPIDFLGPKTVVTLYPDAAGDLAQWTPSAGDNWDCVDDPTVADDDTTYVEADAARVDLYNFGSVPGEQVGTVVGVQVNADVKISGTGGLTSLSLPAKLSGTQSDGSPVTISSEEYVTASRVMEKCPDGAIWTVDNLNNCQFGIALD